MLRLGGLGVNSVYNIASGTLQSGAVGWRLDLGSGLHWLSLKPLSTCIDFGICVGSLWINPPTPKVSNA